MPIIKHETFIHAPVEQCFDLARTVEVHAGKFLITSQKAVDGVTTGLLELDDYVTWETAHFGLKQRLTSRITRMEKPYVFQDEMVCGLFQSFTHTHLFHEVNHGTLMVDQFIYTSPFGMLGKIADDIFLEKYMRKFIQLQAENVKKISEMADEKLIE